AIAGRRARRCPRRPDQVRAAAAGKAAAAGAGLEIDREEEVVADGDAAVGVDPAPEGGDRRRRCSGRPDEESAGAYGDAAECRAGQAELPRGILTRILDE